MKKAEFTSAVKKVFDACRHLSETSGKIRLFTPDGRMVGDIGEIIAGNFYKVELHNVGRHGWDGTYNGINVQIKTTGGNDTYLKKPRGGFGDGLMLVFRIYRESGEYKLIYNGDIQRVWDELENIRPDRTGAKMISLDRLRRLQKSVHQKNIIPETLR